MSDLLKAALAEERAEQASLTRQHHFHYINDVAKTVQKVMVLEGGQTDGRLYNLKEMININKFVSKKDKDPLKLRCTVEHIRDSFLFDKERNEAWHITHYFLKDIDLNFLDGYELLKGLDNFDKI